MDWIIVEDRHEPKDGGGGNDENEAKAKTKDSSSLLRLGEQ